MPTGSPAARAGRRQRGYVMIVLIIAVAVLSVLLLMAVPLWQTEAQREAEEELIFRGRQYVTAIGLFVRSHHNLYPQNLEILRLEKFLRQLYPDPVSPDGRWDLVFQENQGGKPRYLVAPAHAAKSYAGRAQLVGVCSTSPASAFREYRGRSKYNEWAFYLGAKETEEMPELHYEAGGK